MKNDTTKLENSVSYFMGIDSFSDNKESEVNPWNVKEKLIENIKNLPEIYPSELIYLYRLFKLTEFHLSEKVIHSIID